MASNQKVTMHHLALAPDRKKPQLFKVIEKLKHSDAASKIIILTSSNLTADYLSLTLNLKGINAGSINQFKSAMEIEKTTEKFFLGLVKILVSDKVDIKLSGKCALHVINYDMFIPNILYCETHHSDDIFHNE